MSGKYDYLIVGSGLYGATFAQMAIAKGKSCLVIDKRKHIGGNLFCENVDGINVHKYGAHIFHTSNKRVWDYVNSFVEFNNFINSPMANYKGKLYNLPFNMNTFYQLWGVITPEDAIAKIQQQQAEFLSQSPSNLEEQAISLVGRDIYETLINGYTQKQWGRKCCELPAFIIKRLPVRFTFDNNYFNDRYQGIPEGGYNILIDKMLEGADIITDVDYLSDKNYFDNLADIVVYTGAIDEYFSYSLGKLEYRTLRFENERLDSSNYQGCAVINYTDIAVPYTRVIEHKHFEFGNQPHTIITKEYSSEWSDNAEPYYPVNDAKNNSLYNEYAALAAKEKKVIFGGRLAQYKYFDMHHIIEQVFEYFDENIK